jgi:hypothetical protein
MYYQGIKSRKMKWARHRVNTGKMRNAYRILVDEPNGKSPIWRPKFCGRTVFKLIVMK